MRRVAITGIGAISPNGIGRERFWKATREGASGVRRITRFDPSGFLVQVAGEIPEEFDETAFVNVKDRPHVSRAAPLAVASVTEAMADAGLDAGAMTRDELRAIGVIVGSGGGSQDFTEEQYRLFYTGHQKQCSVYTIPTSTIGTLASEVSMRFGFRGLSHIVSTGCTSSTDALGYAFRHIKYGSMDTMVAGGVDSPIAPLILRGFQLMRIMSTRWNQEPSRASRPFSRDRDGFVIAEGAWFFMLEELEQARRARGAHLRRDRGLRLHLRSVPPRASGGVRRGTGARHGHGDGRGRHSALGSAVHQLPRHLHGAERPHRNARRQAGVRRFAQHLAGSALKSLIGHPQGACGAAGVAATLLGMRDNFVHPTINVDEPDPECDLDYVEGVGRKLSIEHAVANCIAFGSKNSALVLSRV